jgi:hypothetical protein
MSHLYLNTVGLIANMIGVVLLFFFGFPQPTHNEEVTVTVEPEAEVEEGRKAADIMMENRRRRRFYLSMSLVALIIMVSGYGMQLLALWV